MEKKYCAAPWRGLHINPRGDVKTCCAGDPNMLGNLNTQSISEIISGSMLNEVRHSISQGVLHPVYCKNCIEAERYGTSERLWHNSVNQDFDRIPPGEHKPSIIDVRWNTTCNLACNYCGPKCSSRWAGLMREQHQSGTRAYYQQVCEYIAQHRDAIREVALVGGEPLLLIENSRLISVLPPEVLITIITNLSVDLTNNPVMQKLREHNRVSWCISFDNVGERFEYVRYGGQWSLLEGNIQHIDALRRLRNHDAGIHAVYNLYNCTRLCELRSYADSVGFDIHWQTLFHPDQLNPAMHAPWVRELAKREIKQYRARFTQTSNDNGFFERVLNELDTIDPDWKEISVKFKKHTHLMEHKYHTGCLAFDQLWPELSDIL